MNPYADIMGTDTPTAPNKAKSTVNIIRKGLKKTLEAVERNSGMIPPLKTAAGAILSLWDVIEVCLPLPFLVVAN